MKTFKIKAMVWVLFIFAGLSTLFAGDVTFFGPKQYTRNQGKPVTETDTFICPPNYTGSGFTLRLINGDSQGKNRVSSAVITVNGVQVMGPSDFNRQVGIIERTVSLTAGNEISVKLNSKPGAYVIIDIHKFIAEPEVSFIATPDTIQYQQSSTLSWNVLNADTITIDNGIGSVGPTGSVQVSPGVPTTTYTLTAVNLGGTTTKLVTVTVIFPVPTITFSASPLIIRPGVSSTLTWTTFAAHTATIAPGIGNVNLNGSLVVSPVETTTYTITAAGYGGTQTAGALVTVDAIPPQINVTQPMEGAYVNIQNILLKGQVVDTSPVTFKVNGKDTTLQPDNSFEVPLQLAEGPNTIALAAEDAAGNPSTLTLHVVADTIAPQLQITAPKNNDFLNTPVITVTGTLTDANPDKVILNNSIQGVIDGSTFTINNVQLNEGSNTLSVEAFDKAGNRTQVSVSCTLDTAAPALVITAPENGTVFKEIPITVTGTVSDINLLKVLLNNQHQAAISDNTFTFAGINLSEGENPLTVTAEDKAGNTSSQSITVSYIPDSDPPEIAITSPQDGTYRNNPEVLVSGTVTDQSAIAYVRINGQNAQLQGQDFTHTFTLNDGENTITVEAADVYENKGSVSVTVTLDTHQPQITVTQPQSGVHVNTGQVVVKGEIIDASPVTVTINNNGVSLQNNQFETILSLSEGANTIAIAAEDAAGNKNTHTLEVFSDTTAPALAIASPQDNSMTNKDKMTISGQITDAYPFSITLVSTGQEGEIIGNHFYFRDIALQPGQNTFELEVKDRAGNTAQHSITIVRDSVVPQLTVLQPVNGALLSQRPVLVKGTAADDHLKEVKVNGTTCTIDPGTNAFNLLVSLMEGTNSINVTAADTAGNVKSENLLVTVDTVLPNINIATPRANAILNTSSIMVSGTADDINLAVVKINGQTASISNNQFTLANVSLQEGENTITVEVKDSAGNTSRSSVSVTLDTSAPTIKSVIPADNAAQVPLSSRVRAEFSEVVDLATLTDQVFYLEKEGEKLNGTIQQEGTIVVFQPTSPLPDSARVYVHVTTGITDKAGNALHGDSAFHGSFFTKDGTAPAAPVLTAIPEKTSLNKITLNGTAEKGSSISVSGGLTHVEGLCDDQGSFSLEVYLKPDTLNQLCVTANDTSGNESIPSCLSIYQESAELIVQDAEFETNQIRIIFSRPIDSATLTSDNVVVSSASGPQSGVLTTAANNTEGIFTPGVDLSSQMVMVEVKTGIKDVEGIGLSYPFVKVFNQPGGEIMAQGEVYDDHTGLPLAGALVRLVQVDGSAPSSPAPSAMTTPEGKYVLVLPPGSCVLEMSKENYTRSHRWVLSAPGFSSPVFDTRLTPLHTEAQLLVPGGGTLSNGSGVLVYPDGAVDMERSARLTKVGPQGLAGRLPPGWSPLQVFDLHFQDETTGDLLKPCQLRCINHWPDASSSSFILALWDETGYKWKAVSTVSVSPEDIGGTIEKKGQYAFLIKDTAPAAPPQPVLGDPLPAVARGSVPTTITANLDFNPGVIYPGDTSRAVLTITSTEAISSGTPVQAKISENYELLSGSTAAFTPYTADLTAYNYGTASSKVEFHVSPNSKITLSELKIGTIQSDMVRYSAGALGMVVGPDGATVAGDGGSEIVIEPGSVNAPIAVTLKRLEPMEINTPVPSGFEVIGALDLSLGGAKLLKPGIISLSLSQEQLSNIPQDAQLLTVKLEKLTHELVWVLTSQGIVENSRIKSFTDTGTGLTFPGVREGGTYVFLRALSPLGFISGTVTQNAQPFSGALVSLPTHEIRAISRAAGNYVQVGFTGAVELTAKDLVTGNQGTGSGNIQDPGDILPLSIAIMATGPEIVSITPENNAEEVPLNSKITFIFSKPVKAAAFTDQTVYIIKGTDRVGGVFQLSSDGKQGEFVPHQDFASDSTISITVTTGLQDLNGTPMAQVFSSAFKTVDVTVPEADFSKITIHMPVDGKSNVVGEVGAVEPGAEVIIVNETAGKTVTVNALSDGSFSADIDAIDSDRIIIKVRDTAGNETVLAARLYVGADGKQVIMDSRGGEFISREGLGIRVEPGTFTGSTTVGLSDVSTDSTLAPPPQDFNIVKAVRVDFSGNDPMRPFTLSIPSPVGIPEDAQLMVVQQVEVFGKKQWMYVGMASLVKSDQQVQPGGTIPEDQSQPSGGGGLPLMMVGPTGTGTTFWRWEGEAKDQPGELYERIWAFMWNWNARLAFAVMTFMNPHAMVSAMDLVLFTHPQELIMPFPINHSVEIEVRDLDTGEMLFRKDLPALTSPGQLYDFGNLAAGEYDKDPPAITGSTGMLILSCDVSPNTVVSRGITITPQVSEEKVTGIQIQGKPGTAVVVEPGDTPGKVRIYRLEEDTSDPTSEGQKRYTQLSDSFNVKEDGSFSGSVTVRKGDRLIITVETGDVDLGQEFLFSFSEPLDTSYRDTDVPIEFYEVTEESGEEKIKVYTDLLDTGTDVLVKPENQLKENVKYVVKFMEVLDRAGNPLELTCEFHTRRSRTLLSQGNMQNAYDTLVIGDKLFAAAGQDGIKVFDVSDPSKLGYVTTHSVLGSVFALDVHIGVDGKKNLVAVGGGSADGFIKLFEIDDLYDPNKPDLIYQISSQVISEWLGMEGAMGGYVDGIPRDVYVLDNYAFVAVMGGGLVIVDLELMKDMTNQSALIGYWPYDELVSKVHAFKKEIKDPQDPEDPDNPDAPAQTRYYAVLLVEYFGIRILDVTDADHPKEWAFLNLGKNENLTGLDVALDYWVDVDLDGRKGDEEDLDTEKDINDTPEMRDVTAREELKDLLFFTVPSEGKVYVVDFTNHPGAGGELNIKKTIPIAGAHYIGDIRLSEKDRLLYVADNNLGLVVLDMSFNGHTLDRSGDETDRVLGTIETSGKSQFGITIDEDLNVAYVGQLEKGVDMVKLANPEVKFVYLDSETGIYHEAEKIAPMGLRERDNPADPVTGKKLPGEIYVMAVLPGDTGLKSDVEDGKFFVEAVLWGLNKYHHPIISWDDGSGVKSYFKKLKLYRQSDNPYEEKFKMFLSKPIQVTIDPVKPESGTPGGNDPIKVLSGDFLWVHLSGKVHENLANSGESNVYLTRNDCRLSGDKKPSVRADLVDRYKNLDKNEEEKPNSPVNNPAMYNSVYLHSGEFVHSGADVIIPGRGFDFAFIRTYRSQGIYSGVLGWGWDHNYNKRLLEMPGGDILYFDGTGRRERYKAQKAGSRITGYIVPEGWFTRLKKKEDGTFRLIYPDLFVEYYDEMGMLIKIKDRNDNRMEFYYDIAGQMTAVMDTMGRMIDFEYYPLEFEAADSDPEGRIKITSGRLKQITDFSGRVIKYEYNEQNGDLEKVDFAGRVTQYTYAANADLKLAHNLKTSIDPEGRTVFTVTYEDGVDKAKEQQQGDSRVAYSTGESGASVTDGRGNVKGFNIQDGHPEQISEGGYQTGFTYNDDGLVQSVTYPELNSITYGYPTVTDKTNKRSAANLQSISENPGPRGDGGSPKTPTTFTYESMTNQVTSIAYPNGLSVTNSNEDENGNFRNVETNVEGLSYQLDYNKYGQVKSETNPFGMATSYEYFSEASPGGNESSEMGRIPDSDTGGYLETMTSDLVTRNFQEYDKRGNLLNYNDSHGTTVNYSFTDHDELQTENVVSASSMSPLVYNGTYGYYQNGLLQSQQTNFGSNETPVSNTTTYTYTPRNMLDTETESDRGITTIYSYDQNDNLTGISNTLDSISFTYNDRDLVETVTLGSDVGGSAFTYDGNGNVTTAMDKYGNTTAYQYDGYDRLQTIIDPLNNQTLISRLDNGNTLNIKQYDKAENKLRETVRVNDPIGRVKQYTVKMPFGNDETYSYTYAYSDEGQVITISDSLSRTWTISKNKQGQVFFQQDPAGNTIEYFYEDGRGNMTRMIETEVQADGTKKTYTTHYTYNAFNKIEEIKETVGDGETIYTTFTYDERGNLTGSKDAEGNTISHKYDNFGRRIWSKRHFKTTGATITTRFEYYANDMLWKIIDDKENVTEYKYDDQKRLTRVIYPDNSEIDFTYTEEIVDNKKYRVVIETQRNGTKVTSSYDGLNRLVSRISIPAGGVGGISESYDYDGLNRLTKASDNDTTVEFAYDPLNRLTEEKQQGKVIGYTYSVMNNLRKMTMTYPNGRVIEKDFDLLDRVSKIKQGQDNIADFSYIGRSYRVLSKQFGNGDAISYLYDQGRRLHQKETKNKNLDLINRYVYGYNNVHMKTYEQRGHNNNAGDVYTYDDVYRLTNVKINVPDPTVPNPTEFEKEKTFNFDKLDNILSIVETQNEQTVTKTTQINPILNQYENFAGWGLSYDLNGNTTQKGTQHFTYDYRNQVIKAKDQTTEADYKYDALGRRIQKAVTVGSATKTTNYYYSGMHVIEERDGSDNVLNQYIYGKGIDEILRMDKYTGTGSTPYYFHTNAIGSVTAITYGNGSLIERVSYDTYGMPTFTDAAGEVVPKSTIGNTLLFHGRRYDAETNLYYFRARYYDPIMGRFLQTDPMGYEDSMNLYQGFNMNPLNFVDPFGLAIKLTGGEMVDFQANLEEMLADIYRENYEPETAERLVQIMILDFTLEEKVKAYNEMTGLGLEVPERLSIFDKIFGTAKSFASISKQVKKKVERFWGLEKAQEIIDSAKDNWFVSEADASFPGYLTIGSQLNVVFAKGWGSITEFSSEELQWLIVAGVLKGGLKYLDDIKLHSRLRKVRGRYPVWSQKYAGKYVPLEDLPLKIRQKYPRSVYFTGTGFPDFSPYAIKKVKIKYTGNRAVDFKLANKAAGYNRTPRGYTWHHHHDAETMFLVPTDLHDAIKHSGGVSVSKIPY